MRHTLSQKSERTAEGTTDLSVIELEEKRAMISISEYKHGGIFEDYFSFTLNKDQLHSFIGTLLHVQQKMK